MKTEQRLECRLPESTLPQRLRKIMVSADDILLGCQVMDASLHGLGFVVDKAYNGEVVVGQNIKIGFESVEVDGRVVNLNERYAHEAYRFGVRLYNEDQLHPYHRMLVAGKN